MMIETQRLILRELTGDDFPALYKVLSDRESMRYYPYVFDEARVKDWISRNIERYHDLGFGLWAVCLKETGELIGDCGLTMQVIDGVIRPEIGYHIRSDCQRQGYAAEAACAVRDWAFERTPFRVLYSYMNSENLPSARTAQAYGCKLVTEYEDGDNGRVSVYSLARKQAAQT
ncbi:MAG: GNAT family N-acetyltransferase [Ruminococcus sp.]|nr:GNAT family N-acetyltransferase [Ruminococcus sp.]